MDEIARFPLNCFHLRNPTERRARMKGVVFTEFLELVEQEFGYDQVDEIIQQSNLPNDGAYTAVGTYDHEELLRLVTNLSSSTSIPVPDLVKKFGGFLFSKLVVGYPGLLENTRNSFQLLSHLHSYIHVEVRKLYPDAELPDFEHRVIESNRLELTYRSTRPFADLAEGLIVACIGHFTESATLEREDLEGQDNTSARFTITYENGLPAL
jgi:hypothetical protein